MMMKIGGQGLEEEEEEEKKQVKMEESRATKMNMKRKDGIDLSKICVCYGIFSIFWVHTFLGKPKFGPN
jgi:hypothetical protein